MATRSIVPRAAGEGGLGTAAKPWGKVYANEIAGNPALTGTPTAPTAEAGTNNDQIATTAFVANELADKLETYADLAAAAAASAVSPTKLCFFPEEEG